MSATENIPEEVSKTSTRIRRTKVMIVNENKQILDYFVKGATHEQIMKWVGLNEKNYWKRIAAIRKRNFEGVAINGDEREKAYSFTIR